MVLVYKLERSFDKRHKELCYYAVEYFHENLKVCCLTFINFKQKVNADQLPGH